MGRHRVTLQTIADRVGVSRTTVSNAFSRPDQLSDELRERVLGAARELNYAGPDPAARTLRAGRTGSIGVLLTESLSYAFEDPYAAAFLTGVAHATEREALSLLLIPVPPGHLQEQAVRNAVVDGLCVHTMPDDHPVIEIALCRGVPVVFADGPEVSGHPFVGVDERAAAGAMVDHVLATGRRRIGVVTFRIAADEYTGDVDDERLERGVYRASTERLQGILAAAAGAGLTRADTRIVEAGRNVPEGGRRATAALLDGPHPPDAIVCLSDQLAAGAVEEVAARGLSLPADVAVTGWDDTQLARRLDLTTVDQPDEEKGRIAGQWLIEGVRGARREILPTTIVARGSTGG
jgi:DNA-binding LacI/PurR family transcriptional regulator